jgi:hypothetical protein
MSLNTNPTSLINLPKLSQTSILLVLDFFDCSTCHFNSKFPKKYPQPYDVVINFMYEKGYNQMLLSSDLIGKENDSPPITDIYRDK